VAAGAAEAAARELESALEAARAEQNVLAAGRAEAERRAAASAAEAAALAEQLRAVRRTLHANPPHTERR
jgi:hypothetical protein